MRVVGTAGHVDHGKSTLVQRLTGIDPDRLKEEKARKLTIDLGFAWFALPDGEMLGIVDVPGHRDFIENMLAGVGGIDAVLLVIAADEGVMPQTREHLAILDLLGVKNGIIVLSKIDMIDDEEWLELIKLDIEEVTQHTALAHAPIMPVSAHTGAGIDDLVQHLTDLLADLPPRTDYNQPRLPVDRIFTVEGFGTVVTGTLSGGTLSVGETVEIQPRAITGRIRGLQSYKQDIEIALPGSRVAVNISGINKANIMRGDVLAYAGQLQATKLIDVYFRHLADVDRPLIHNSEVKFFSGASETVARVRLLNDESLAPDSEGWLQLRLRDAIPLTDRDRFILRYPSPPQTIGGGMIVNAHPASRWKRFRPQVIADLQTRMEGSPLERVTLAAEGTEARKWSYLQKETGYTDAELDAAIESALVAYRLTMLPDKTFMATSSFQALQQQIIQHLREYHRQSPLRLGMPRAEMRSRLNIKQNLLIALSEDAESIALEGSLLRLSEHDIRFSEKQQTSIERLFRTLNATNYSPPSVSDLVEIIGEDVLFALIDLGQLVQITPDIVYAAETYESIMTTVLQLIDEHGEIDAKGVRDAFDSSRKYAIAILEYLDNAGITRRVGDVRVRR